MGNLIKSLEYLPGFWGKVQVQKQPELQIKAWLPLEHHCLDVGLVLRTLVELPAIHRTLEQAAACKLMMIQLDRLAALAMLHDVGKANLGFQVKVLDPGFDRAGHIKPLAPLLMESELRDRLSESLSLKSFNTWFSSEESMSEYFRAIWSHHGTPFEPERISQTGSYISAKNEWWRPQANRDPFEAISKIFALSRWSFPLAFEKKNCDFLPDQPEFIHRFAGLLMLSDWIASDDRFFPIKPMKEKERIQLIKDNADKVLSAIGLDVREARKQAEEKPMKFSCWFPGLCPRPLQKKVELLDIEGEYNQLIIAESETGSGKTEASLFWFFRLFSSGLVDSLYFALPTRVAAREMFKRISQTIAKNFSENKCPITLLAVPGYTQDSPNTKHCLAPEDRRDYDDPNLLAKARLWATERPKRFLSATIGVGTIDQALLSVLSVPHSHLRSVCLDRSLLIVDEVHASDTYMRTILSSLLKHHLRIGGYAMLLSATLGSSAKIEFLQAVDTDIEEPRWPLVADFPYPSITNRSGEMIILDSSSYLKKNVKFYLRPNLFSPLEVVQEISHALHNGARVLVIMNTVNRAIAFQRVIENSSSIPKDSLFKCNNVICPHHGRFAPIDRSILDQTVTESFKNFKPLTPLLLVGTQTLEQSLDIDTDLLVTDLCPADVLLQRVGRLHRHKNQRPKGCEHPHCILLVPDEESLEVLLNKDGTPKASAAKAGLGSVYEDLRILELTMRMLRDHPLLNIPEENRWFVEGATHKDRLALLSSKRWEVHTNKIIGDTIAKGVFAQGAIIRYDQAFSELHIGQLEERIRTRLGVDSLHIPLDRASIGPFGQEINEMLIPGHMAPKGPLPERAEVVSVEAHGEVLHFRVSDLAYKYSRFGIEKEEG